MVGCTIVSKHQDVYLLESHSVVESIEPHCEDIGSHPGFFVVIVYTERSKKQSHGRKNTDFLRLPNHEELPFFSGGAYCQQHGNAVFGSLAAIAQITFHYH